MANEKFPVILDVTTHPQYRPAYDAMSDAFASGVQLMAIVGPKGAIPLIAPERASKAMAKEIAEQLKGDRSLLEELTRSLTEGPSEKW